MGRDPFLEALVAELDQAIVALQSARKLVGDRLRSTRSGRPPAPPVRVFAEPSSETVASLRHSGVTVAEAAAILGIGEEQVRRLLRRGDLEGLPYGGRVGWRLARSYVEAIAAEWNVARSGQAAAKRHPKK